jgi:hypothetical protein
MSDDPHGQELVGRALVAAADYVRAVVAMEAGLLTTRAEGEERRSLSEQLDRNRTLAHNALIDALVISSRYCARHHPEDIPAGGVYPDPDHLMDRNRRAIGDWAGRVVDELFRARK